MKPFKEKISGIVLSGGKSSRMGLEKGFLRIGKLTMIEQAILLLKPYAEELIISANHDDYKSFSLPVVKDEIIEIGPLGGMYSCLKQTNNSAHCMVSCDLPFLESDLIQVLFDAFYTTNADYICACYGAKVHPLVAVFRKEPVLKQIEVQLSQSDYKVLNLLKKLKVVNVDFKTLNVREDVFFNMNTKEDYFKVKKSRNYFSG